MAKFIDTWKCGGTGKGAYILEANTAAQTPLIIKGASGQVANILEIQNSAGTTLYSVDISGNITHLGDNYTTDELTVIGDAAIGGTLNVSGITVLATINAMGATSLSSLVVSGDSALKTLNATNVIVNNNLTINSYAYFNRGLYLSEQVTAPTYVAEKGAIYTKDASSITELFYKDSSNNEVQLTSGIAIGGDDIFIPDDKYLRLGNTAASPDIQIGWNTAQTVDALFVGLSTAQNTMIIAEVGDIAYDFAHGTQTNPTLFIQSATQSATKWGSLTHNQTDFLLTSGGGAVRFAPATNATTTLPATGKFFIDGTITRTGTTEVLDIDATIDTSPATADVNVATITATRAVADTGGTTGLYISVTTGAMADTQDSYGIQVLINDAACSANTSDAIAFSAEAITADANVREIAFMQKTGWDFAFLAQDGAIQMGDATYDCSTFTMIKGAQTSDPQFLISLSENANGDTSLIADTGLIILKPSGDTDDYFTFKTDTGVPTIFATGSYLRIGDAATTANSLDNEDDLMVTGELECYGNLYTGALQFGTDAGLVTAFDMPVSASATDNTVEGYSFAVDGQNIMTIYAQSDGVGSVDNLRVGVGTTTPPTEFSVYSSSLLDPRGILSAQYSTDTTAARIHFRKARGTAASPSIITTGDMLGRLRFSGYDGSNYLQMGSIDIISIGTISSTRVPTYMTFSTATDAEPSVLTERMKIDNAGIISVKQTGELKIFTYQTDALADDENVSLPDATSGIIMVSCNAEAFTALVQNNGTVTLLSNTTNVDDADTDTKLCIYDSTNQAIIKNRLGVTGEIRIMYWYN